MQLTTIPAPTAPLTSVSARLTFHDRDLPKHQGTLEIHARFDRSVPRQYDSLETAIGAAKEATRTFGQPVAVLEYAMSDPLHPRGGDPQIVRQHWSIASVDIVSGVEHLWNASLDRTEFSRIEANDVDEESVFVPTRHSIAAVAIGANLLDRRTGDWIVTRSQENL